jgi:hypothetical protein
MVRIVGKKILDKFSLAMYLPSENYPYSIHTCKVRIDRKKI